MKRFKRFSGYLRMIFIRRLPIVWIWIIPIVGCAPHGEGEEKSIHVFCGSANKPAMSEIASIFERERGVRVNMTFGGSGTLLSQIELSKQGEIYLAGSPDYIIIGERKKLLIKGSDRIVAYLAPAIITPAGNPANIRSLDDLTRPGVRLGIGNPETVCLGLYGIEILEKNGLLKKAMENVITFGGSCSKTANLAALGQVDTILGWRVFHFWNPERMDFVSIAPDRIPRISYIPIAIPVFTRSMDLSNEFIDFVLSPKGREIYKRHGYITSLEKAREFSPRATIGGEYKLPPEYFEALKEPSSD